ncbi:dihydrofolate reductase [Tuberibacillus sp. Marseille-P3662]|uniref:dihydrofolate reductase n=1 Tax=Tuberibacillus sp. Marseille-P3662 TaxID=1965358 RepID=UPI000A1CEDD0|nr:dihydrofolate reductase [Tuberibacillus sp. Marseille-P3662]
MISFIVAMDQNRVIGQDNQLPWRLPADLAFFKRVTMGHPIIMGRKTHESIGKPLPGRENVILTRNESYEAAGCQVVHSLEAIKAIDEQNDEVFVIGGAEIFKVMFASADRLYVTFIDEVFSGDTYFPEIDHDQWRQVAREKGEKNDKNPYDYYYLTYDRI